VSRDKDVKQLIQGFFESSVSDNRIGPVHVSLYMALLFEWARQEFAEPFHVFSHSLMPAAKISGSATYHAAIKDLHRFGYIRYLPSRNYVTGSAVYILDCCAGANE